MRVAIINTETGIVELVLVYDDGTAIETSPQGFGAGYIGVASDQANVGWLWSGGALSEPSLAPVVKTSVLPQDLMAQFTTDDATKIQAAIAGNVSFWLLWQAMTAQRDPMVITNDRFKAGWAALVDVLGAARMAVIAKTLDVTVTA